MTIRGMASLDPFVNSGCTNPANSVSPRLEATQGDAEPPAPCLRELV